MKEKQPISIHHYLVFPVILTLGIFAFISFLWLSKPPVQSQEAGSVGFILEYQQNCACEWPPFSGRCYQENQCQMHPQTRALSNIVCKVQEGKGQWVPSCGNGVIDCSEQCDYASETQSQRSYCDALFGNQNYYNEAGKVQTCTQECTWDLTKVYSYEDCGGYCGDGIVQTEHEQCESDGRGTSMNDQYLCRQCQYQGGYCGDGIVQTNFGEECEQGVTQISNGSCLSTCKIQCASGYHVENNQCVPNSRECQDESGQGTGNQVWNTQTKTWGLCQATQCNPFYRIQGGDCVLNTCPVLDQYGRVAGTGRRETPTSPCTNAVCHNTQTHRIHTLSNGTVICEEARCSGSDTRTCDIQNGVGFQKRTCEVNAHPPQWNDWGVCQITRCFTGYASHNGQCVPTQCYDPLEQECDAGLPHVAQARQTRECVYELPAYPGPWGACTIMSCESGYRIYDSAQGRICEPSQCDAQGQTLDCTQEKANALSAYRAGTCNLQAHPPAWSYGLCVVDTCKPGYRKDVLTNTCQIESYTLSGFAWSSNIGWVQFNFARFPTVMRIDQQNETRLIMQSPNGNYAYNDNIDLINISNVYISNDGKLYGNATYLFDGKTRIINFQPKCNQHDPDCGVRILSNGRLTGQAWDEMFGWLNFDLSCSQHDPLCGVSLSIDQAFSSQFFQQQPPLLL